MELTLYLVKDGVTLDDEIVLGLSKFEEVALQAAGDGVSWTLYVDTGISREPAWLAHLRPILVDGELPFRLRNRSTSAILVVEAHSRIFILTFGRGFHAINSKLIVPGFGLRVTANSVAANRVVSADMFGYGRRAPGRRVVLPAAAELYELGIEPNQEWVRKLTGVADPDFAARANGSDSLKLRIKDFVLRGLPGKLEQILERHEADDYRQQYAFLDNIQQLARDDPLVAELDQQVRQRLLGRDPDLGFAAPDRFDQDEVVAYTFNYWRRHPTCEVLTNDEVYAALDDIGQVDDPLIQIHVKAVDDSGQSRGPRYELRDYIQAEVTGDADSSYVLNAGVWSRVATSWVAEINGAVRAIDDLTDKFNLPEWNVADLADEEDTPAEAAYNDALAERDGYLLLDKNTVRGIGGRNQKIEICDVLTRGRDLLCVKRATKSATLSHLFAQASVSAALMAEPKYRAAVMNHLQKLDPAAITYDGPTGWTFVYAIATDKPGRLADSLFFFSKVNLVTHAREIAGRGFRVALAKIEIRL